MNEEEKKYEISCPPLAAAKVKKEVLYWFTCPFCEYVNSVRPEPKKKSCLKCGKEIFLSWY